MSWRVIASILGPLIFAAPALAKDAANATIRDQAESYFSRPSFFEINPVSHPELGTEWARTKKAHFEAVAMLLEMYPDEHIYFLARDSEYLYDLAKWVSKDEPKLSNRLHLLNVSRSNLNADHVMDYLAQKGISEDALRAGKRVLFVDTGFHGTIPSGISEKFPESLRPNLETHLISSESQRFPSMRVALAAIDPSAPDISPGRLSHVIEKYEHLPRFTDRSSSFDLIDGQWHPMSSTYLKSDGQVDKEAARKYMEDLRYDAQRESSRQFINQRRAQWRSLRSISGKHPPARMVDILKRWMKSHAGDVSIEAIVRDYVEMLAMGRVPGTPAINIPVEQLGLEVIGPPKRGGFSNKGALIRRHPEWAPILTDAKSEVPKLIRSNQFEVLQKIAWHIHDEGFIDVLTRSLGEHPEHPKVRDIIQTLEERGTRVVHAQLAENFFSQPNTTAYKNLLRKIIQRADDYVLEDVNEHVFSKTQWQTDEFNALRRAARTPHPVLRAEYLNQQLGTMEVIPYSVQEPLSNKTGHQATPKQPKSPTGSSCIPGKFRFLMNL